MKKDKVSIESSGAPPMPLPPSLLRLATVLADIAKQHEAMALLKEKRRASKILIREAAVDAEKEGDSGR